MRNLIFEILVGYVMGSLPTAYWVGKFVKGVDIRKHGSGNVGATNVFRVVGKKWGVAVLIFDALKGALAVSFVPSLFPTVWVTPFVSHLISGIAAISGHTWTFWLGFKGGKGVATSAGVFLALAPKAAFAALGVWTLIFLWKRYVSLASMGTAVSFPLWVFCFYWNTERFPVLFPVSLLLTVFIFFTHRENIHRLRSGTEKRLF